LAHWGIFSESETKRKENALMSYGVYLNAPRIRSRQKYFFFSPAKYSE
jgi:hypothetical protein